MAAREIDVIGLLKTAEAQSMAKLLEYSSGKFVQTVNDRMQGIADLIVTYWGELAKSKSPWGSRYATTLVKRIEDGKIIVEVDSTHENAMFVSFMEKGIKPFSIKDKLLAGRRAQQNRAISGKPFVIVPLRKRTPSTIKASGAFSGTMSQQAYDMVKSGKKISPVEAGNMGRPDLGGLTAGGGGAYFTFRMVTPESKGWMHPGAAATPVFDEVVAESERMIEQAMLGIMDLFKEEGKRILEQQARR